MESQSQYESHEIGSGRPVLFQVPKSFRYGNERAQYGGVRLEVVISTTERQPDRLRSTYRVTRHISSALHQLGLDRYSALGLKEKKHCPVMVPLSIFACRGAIVVLMSSCRVTRLGNLQ